MKPKVGDIIVFDARFYNKYGHVAIISDVEEDKIEIIQQNYWHFLRSRRTFELLYDKKNWTVNNDRVLGWLRYRAKI